jgi:hypothetical protein
VPKKILEEPLKENARGFVFNAQITGLVSMIQIGGTVGMQKVSEAL